MKKLIIFVLLLVGFSIPSIAIEYQHQFSEFMCNIGEEKGNQFTIKIYDFEYQKDFSDEKFTEEINNNVGVYPGNMVNNKCKYDLKLYSHYIGLSCFTSIDYDLINIFLPFMGRRETSLLTIYPSEFATIYYSRDSNIPFNKFIDEKNLSKGYTEAFEQFALTSLETGNCIGSN